MEALTDTVHDICKHCPDYVECDSTVDNITNSFINYTLCLNPNLTESDPTKPAIEYMDPIYYPMSYRIIGTIILGIILIVGVLGHIMVVTVVFKSRGMRTPTNCYLVSVSMAGLVVLVASVPNEMIAYYLMVDKWIWGSFGCRLFVFIQYLGINASSLSITAFTIDRYIAICHPMKAQKMCTVDRAKRIITGVWVFATIYCAPWLFLTKTVPVYYRGHTDIETCDFALSRESYKSYYFADMILFYVLPVLLSCVLYGLIAKILFINDMSQKSSKSMNESSSHPNLSSTDAAIAEAKVVKMLALVVAVYATLWLPYRALLVYNSFAEKLYTNLWYLMFAKSMMFVSSAINPIIYSARSINFRRAFKRMLTCDQWGDGEVDQQNRLGV